MDPADPDEPGLSKQTAAQGVTRRPARPTIMNGASPGTGWTRLSTGLGACAFLIGCGVLLGWGFGLGALTRVIPLAVQAKPNAAAGMALAGLAMILLNGRNPPEPVRWAVRLLSALVLLIGALTLGETALDWNAGIDQLLFSEAPGAIDTSSPGRMAPVTAYSLILLAAALLLAGRRHPGSRALAIMCAFGATVVMITGLALASYLWMFVTGEQVWTYAGIALPTLVGLMALGLGTLAWAGGNSRHHWTLGPWTTAGFAAGVLSVLLASGLSMGLANDQRKLVERVAQSHQALRDIEQAMNLQNQLTMNLGRYLVSQDEQSTAERLRVAREAEDSLRKLQALGGENPAIASQLPEIERLIRQRHQLSEQIQLLAPASLPGSTVAPALSSLGTQYPALGEQLGLALQKLEDLERDKLQQRQADTLSGANTAFLLLPVGVDLSLTLLMLVVFSLNSANAAHLRSQRALATSEAQLDAIFNNMGDGIVVRDLEGRIVRANRHALNVLNEFHPGMGPGDAENNVDFFLPSGERLPYADWPSQRARRGDFVHNLELVRKKPATGEQAWQEFNSAPIDNLRGGSRQTIVTFRDITERRLAEAAREQIEGLFRGIFEETPDCIIVADAQRQVVMANPSAHRMFGYAPPGMVGVAVEALLPAEIHEAFAAERVALVASDAPHRVGRMWEFDARRQDGSTFALEIRRTALVTAHGTFLIGVGREIGERRREEEARARLTAIIADSDDAIIGKDLRGVIYSWNKGAQSIFGYTAIEMIGESILRLLPDDRLSEEDDILARIARGESIQHFETVRKTRDGRLIDVSISISPIRNAAGAVVGASKIARDVTQTRLLEAQLRESQKMEAIGMLASGIAHDFNNILGALLGNVELAEQDMQGHAAAMDSLQEVRKAGRRARDLVQQILAFGRRQATRREVISLTGVVEESVRLLRATLPARVSLQSTCVNGTPDILADPTQVQQVLLNLGANAVHAMSGKSGFIEVKIEPCEVDAALARKVSGLRNGRHARVTFSDTGHGMDAATLGRIFEPFFTTKPQGEGTGLGMSVVHGIIRDHEGAIAVHSAPGKGTRIELYFPAAGAVAADMQKVTAVAVTHTGGRLLYIDDDEAMVYLVRRMMERRGYHVSGFCDSALALESLRNDPARYDLAVTDYNMPGQSGTEVAADIRRLRPGLPVALVSGYITDEMRAEAERAGVREVLVKANVAEEFCDAVQRLLQRDA